MYFKRCNINNYSNIPRKKSTIKYIVVHYTANNGDTARGNVNYFARMYVGASAHYFIDENEVCCSVPFDNIAYHCGAKNYIHKYCRNYNSIGVELCSRKDKDGNYYFKDNTVNNAVRFISQLMENYNIPIENVIRHYDVTGKLCPMPLINENDWILFKQQILNVKEVINDMTYYEKITDIPEGELRNVIQELINRGVIKGTGAGLHLSEDMVRLLVYLWRANIFKKEC